MTAAQATIAPLLRQHHPNDDALSAVALLMADGVTLGDGGRHLTADDLDGRLLAPVQWVRQCDRGEDARPAVDLARPDRGQAAWDEDRSSRDADEGTNATSRHVDDPLLTLSRRLIPGAAGIDIAGERVRGVLRSNERGGLRHVNIKPEIKISYRVRNCARADPRLPPTPRKDPGGRPSPTAEASAGPSCHAGSGR